MATKYQREDEIDQRANELFDSHPDLKAMEDNAAKEYVDAGTDQAEAFANDPSSALSKLEDQAPRQQDDNGLYRPDSTAPGGQSLKKMTLKTVFSGRKAATGGIIGMLIAALGGMTLLLTPSLAVVQLKEVMTDDLNDQLAAMDDRTTHVFKAKFNDIGKGVCTGVKVRCGYKNMSKRQINKFIAAGIEVDYDAEPNTFNKYAVRSLTFTDSAGNSIKIDNPSKINSLIGDRLVRNSLRKAFNPKFMGVSDAIADKVMERFNTNKADKIGDGDTEDKDKAITSAVEGNPIEPEAGKTTTTNDAGDEVDDVEKNKNAQDSTDRIKSGGLSTSELFASTAKNGVYSAAKGVMLTAAADTACSVKNAARAVEAGAKLYRQRQLVAYAMVFLTFADEVKAGTATPERAEYVGNKLTAIDTRKTIIDETSSIKNETDSPEEVENPNYGQNAFDSAGFKVASYNEAPSLSAREMQFTIGGGALMGTLASINNYVGKYSNSSCKVIQNNFVRAGSFIVGIFAGVVTIGSTLALNVVASVAIGMAIPILENYLAQIVAGTVADGETEGVDSGNAIFAGTAGFLGALALGRGMKPATKNDLRAYTALNESVKNEYIAAETEDAKKTPFDAYNRYSFLGSITRSLLPLQTSSSVSVGNGIVSNLSSLVPLATNSMIPGVNAASEFNEDRFSKCKDSGYEELGIDADIFCNVRYTMSEFELGLDTTVVREWMNGANAAGTKYVDDEGARQGDYAEWWELCANRTAGWGEVPEDQENGGEGVDCMSKADLPDGKQSKWSDEQLSYFRVYTMDDSIIEAMDYTPPAGTTTTPSIPVTSSGAGTDFLISSYNITIKGNDSTRSQSVGVIKDRGLQVVGTQELESEAAFNQVEREMSDKYDVYPQKGKKVYRNSPYARAIFWDRSKFSLVKGELLEVHRMADRINGRGGDPQPAYVPIVWLEDNQTKQVIIVMNTHNPAYAAYSRERYQNAKLYVQKLGQLKQEGLPMFFTGDFNEGYGVRGDTPGEGANRTYQLRHQNLLYCMFAENKLMTSAELTAEGKQMTCPNQGVGGVDYIYHSAGVQVQNFGRIEQSGSDHAAIFARMVVPNTGTPGQGGEIQFPLAMQWWRQFRLDFLKPHSANSGTWTNGVDSLAADIGTPPDGTPVYAMVGGTVSNANLGTSTEKHGLVIKSEIQGGVLEIAYAHGPRTNDKTSYTAGEEIMKIGELGNANGGHLHIDMSFNGRGVCPQYVFTELGAGNVPDFAALAARSSPPC